MTPWLTFGAGLIVASVVGGILVWWRTRDMSSPEQALRDVARAEREGALLRVVEDLDDAESTTPAKVARETERMGDDELAADALDWGRGAGESER